MGNWESRLKEHANRVEETWISMLEISDFRQKWQTDFSHGEGRVNNALLCSNALSSEWSLEMLDIWIAPCEWQSLEPSIQWCIGINMLNPANRINARYINSVSIRFSVGALFDARNPIIWGKLPNFRCFSHKGDSQNSSICRINESAGMFLATRCHLIQHYEKGHKLAWIHSREKREIGPSLMNGSQMLIDIPTISDPLHDDSATW